MLARGAVDVIAVMQEDGSIKSSPFLIKLRREGNFLQEVEVEVNGKKVSVQMRLNESGHAVFVQPKEGGSSHIDDGMRDAKKRLQNDCQEEWTASYEQTYSEDVDEFMYKLEDKKEMEVSKGESSLSKNRDLFSAISNSASSDLLLSWNLVPGRNHLLFRQFPTLVSCHLYLWKWTDKVVISDVDGTITKSDMIGLVLGKNWTQPYVARLYSAIGKKGYRFIYLTARAIAEASITKKLLKGVVQLQDDGKKYRLPAGPLLLSDSSLLRAFKREVIERRPDRFKIDCLSDVVVLFPDDHPPFYAGFGNRPTDVKTYTEFKMSNDRIFTVNEKGELKDEDKLRNSSYCELVRRVVPNPSCGDELFPQTLPGKSN